MSHLHHAIWQTRREERCREIELVARRAGVRAALAEPPPRRPYAITIRPDLPEDAAALARLALLDSSTVPPAPLLVAEVGGELRAARSLRDGTTIASPFCACAAILDLLAARARHLGGESPASKRWHARRLLPRGLRALLGV